MLRKTSSANSTPSRFKDAISPSVKRVHARIVRLLAPAAASAALDPAAEAVASAVPALVAGSVAGGGWRLRARAQVAPWLDGWPGGRDRSANFGPPAPPKRLRGKKGTQQEHRPRGPIKERSGGRIYAVDDLEDDKVLEATDEAATDEAVTDSRRTR